MRSLILLIWAVCAAAQDDTCPSTTTLSCTVTAPSCCDLNNPPAGKSCPSNIGPSTTCGKILPLTGCYCFVYTRYNWTAARDNCVANGMALASLNNQYENDIIIDVLKKSGYSQGFWTSGSSANGVTGPWKWDDGSSFTISDWCPDPNSPTGYQPYNSGWTGDYMYINVDWCWFDGPQSSPKFSICEKSDA